MEEYLEHVKKRNAAPSLQILMQYLVVPDKCIGCTLCARNARSTHQRERNRYTSSTRKSASNAEPAGKMQIQCNHYQLRRKERYDMVKLIIDGKTAEVPEIQRFKGSQDRWHDIPTLLLRTEDITLKTVRRMPRLRVEVRGRRNLAPAVIPW